jgi:hypothetical protein
MRFSWLSMLLVVAGLVACGGKTESGSPSSEPGTNSPTNVSQDPCGHACDRISTCIGDKPRNESCVSVCAGFDDSGRSAYDLCIGALSCKEIQDGLSMNYGPLGECWSRGKRR